MDMSSHCTSCSLNPMNGSGMRPALSNSTCTSDGDNVADDQEELSSSRTDATDVSRCFQVQFCDRGVTTAAILHSVKKGEGFRLYPPTSDPYT